MPIDTTFLRDIIKGDLDIIEKAEACMKRVTNACYRKRGGFMGLFFRSFWMGRLCLCSLLCRLRLCRSWGSSLDLAGFCLKGHIGFMSR